MAVSRLAGDERARQARAGDAIAGRHPARLDLGEAAQPGVDAGDQRTRRDDRQVVLHIDLLDLGRKQCGHRGGWPHPPHRSEQRRPRRRRCRSAGEVRAVPLRGRPEPRRSRIHSPPAGNSQPTKSVRPSPQTACARWRSTVRSSSGSRSSQASARVAQRFRRGWFNQAAALSAGHPVAAVQSGRGRRAPRCRAADRPDRFRSRWRWRVGGHREGRHRRARVDAQARRAARAPTR